MTSAISRSMLLLYKILTVVFARWHKYENPRSLPSGVVKTGPLTLRSELEVKLSEGLG